MRVRVHEVEANLLPQLATYLKILKSRTELTQANLIKINF